MSFSGMDKILESMDKQGPRGKNVTVTNDGATILQSIWVDNPAAKILVDMSRTQVWCYLLVRPIEVAFPGPTVWRWHDLSGRIGGRDASSG